MNDAMMIVILRSGYRSTSGLSYLKSYSSAACNIIVMHDECAVGLSW